MGGENILKRCRILSFSKEGTDLKPWDMRFNVMNNKMESKAEIQYTSPQNHVVSGAEQEEDTEGDGTCHDDPAG